MTKPWQRPTPSASEFGRDAVLAAVVAFGAGLSALLYGSIGLYDEAAQWWIAAACILGFSAPLAWRRKTPELVAVMVAMAFAATIVLHVPEGLFINIALFVAVYTVGAWGRNRFRATLVRWAIIVAMFAWMFVEFLTRGSDATAFMGEGAAGPVSPVVAFGLIQLITNLLYFGGAYFFGNHAWQSARQRAALDASTTALAAERAHTAAQAVALERVRIARELHDVVAHHVSVMGVQAGAARKLLGHNPAAAAESLGAIESSAREAVDELHRMLYTLRDDDAPEQTAGDSPSTRGLHRLPELVADAASAGLPVSFSVIGDPRDVPSTIGLSVYRVAQESITNTIKHAGRNATADLRLRYLDDSIEVELSDTGMAVNATSAGAGLGHLGMRERVSAVGGTIELGARPRGGYRVRARFPTVFPVADRA